MVRVKTTDFKSNLQERVREHIERESASNDLVGPQSPTSLLSVEEMSAAVVGKVMQELDTVSPAGTRDGTWASKSEIDHLASKFSGLENEIRSVHALLRSGGGPDASAVFMEKLEAFVETPGALRYTPRADDTGANDTFVSVRKAAGGHDAVVEALRAEIVGVFRDWADDPDDFKPFDASWRGNNLVDLDTQLEPNFRSANLRAFLTATTDEEFKRDTVQGSNPTIEDVIDESFLGKVAHVGLQDIGAEVIGREALVLPPEGADESFVIFFEYSHS